jgi:predicted nucleic acid-binding protein
MPILIDSNILLDVLTEDPEWFAWSSQKLAEYADITTLHINPVIYAEVSIRFHHIEELEEVLPRAYFQREPLPYEAAFLAGKCFLDYRKRGGTKHSPLPDFMIGAHAAVMGWPLLTRDVRRYATYFPKLSLVTPFSG